jgi:hypothetical protein
MKILSALNVIRDCSCTASSAAWSVVDVRAYPMSMGKSVLSNVFYNSIIGR